MRVRRVPKPASLGDLLDQVSGAGTMARLEGVFDLMKVAEDEIQVVVVAKHRAGGANARQHDARAVRAAQRGVGGAHQGAPA